MVGAGAIPTRTTRDHITTRRPIPRDRRAAGRGYAFGATGTGHTAGRGAAGKKKPAGQAGFLCLIQRSALIPFAHIDEMTGNRSRCRHCRRHQVRAALVTLTPFKIAVRSRCAALARLQLVGVHRKAHRAARLAPLEARILEDLVEPLGFDSVWGVEHHFTDYTMCPDVLQYLTWIAARTTRVQIGSMVVVLPWHDPLRVAEQICMLDAMSGDATLFARADEVEQAWSFIDEIEEAWHAKKDAPELYLYPAGSWGPEAADDLLARDGRAWRRL